MAKTPRTRILDATDSLENLISGLGGVSDKSRFTTFAANIMAPQQLETAYRYDWVARKIVDIPSGDSTRAWRNWQADAADITAIEAAENHFNARHKVKSALQKARLYGGAAIVLGVNQGLSSDELLFDKIRPGDLQFIHAVSRYELTAGPINFDLTSPWFGEPTHYVRASSQGGMTIFHPSRVVRLVGAEHPNLQASDGWGDSVIQVAADAIKTAGTVTGGIAQMVHEAKLDIIKIPGLNDNVGDTGYQSRLKARFSLANQAKSVFSMLLLDGAEEWDRITANFTNLPELLHTYLLIVSAAADIPATRMLGQSPAGLSSTGESDVRNYYDRLSSEQSTVLGPALHRLDEVLLRSVFGKRPEEIFYVWSPLWQMDEKEKAEVAERKSNIFRADVDSGLFNPEMLAKARFNQLIEDATYPGLEGIAEEMGDAIFAEQVDTPEVVPNASGDPLDPNNDPNQENQLTPEQLAILKSAGGKGAAAVNNKKQTTDGKPKTRKRKIVKDMKPLPLYVSRPVTNAAELMKWVRSLKLKGAVLEKPEDLHVTICHSTAPVDWLVMGETYGEVEVGPGGPRVLELFGVNPDTRHLVLSFASRDLRWRHHDFKEFGASYEFEQFQPHISIAKVPVDFDLTGLKPYTGAIKLGPEIFEEIL